VVPVKMPLSIQFGPVLRSYRELPVTLGRHPGCQFVVEHPAVTDRHAQIFWADGKYRVGDLTGGGLVRINRRPIDLQATLEDGDLLELTPRGPAFHYVADGRLAEAEEAVPEPPPPPTPPPAAPEPEKKGGSIFKKLFGG
jgi:pSer/pThr/pTyr-binding forkhead associated (FHA) protein